MDTVQNFVNEKQDSVVSLFLYLDSVFKHKHKLIHNQAPVWNRHCPFLFNLHKRKIYGLFYSIVRRKWKFWFRVLSDFSIQVLNEIGCVDYFSDFQRELEENSQIIPVVSPWKYSIWYFPPAFPFPDCQVLWLQPFVGCIIDILHIRCKLFLILINDIFTGISSDVPYRLEWMTEGIHCG